MGWRPRTRGCIRPTTSHGTGCGHCPTTAGTSSGTPSRDDPTPSRATRSSPAPASRRSPPAPQTEVDEPPISRRAHGLGLRGFRSLRITLWPGPTRIRIIDTAIARAGRAWSRLDTVLLAVITLGAAALRFASLGRPIELVFDEIFYARDACWYVYGSESVCDIAGPASRAHPPLGKWLIGSGIALFGYDPFGWRVAAALDGTLTVVLVYLLGRRLFAGSVSATAASVGAAAAAALLAIDFLHLVQSRVGMLDAFIVLFVVAALLAVVLDRDRDRDRDRESRWWRRITLGRPWRLAAGVFLGAAAATKWSGAYVAPAVIGLVVAWEIAERRRRDPDAGWAAWVGGAFRREALPTFVVLGIVPLLVYVASYTGRMPGELIALPWVEGSVWRGIWEHQRAMLDFHTALSGDHPYQSPPWSWPLIKRPVAYWFSDEGD